MPLRHTFVDDCETPVSAFLKLRGARPGVPAGVGRAGPARRALVVHRLPPAQRAALVARRRRRPVRARRRRGRAPPPGAAARPAAVRRRRGRLLRLRPRAHGRAAGRAEPRPGRPARHRADAHRRARRVRPPQAHGHDPRQRLRRGRGRRAAYAARAADDRRGARAPGRPAAAARRARGRRAGLRAATCRASSSRGWSRGSSSTSTPATPSRSCPAQRWSAEVDVDAFSIYRGLRAVNPSPYMYFLDFEDFQIVGASPEPLVTVTGGRATTRPIAGTRPRGGDVEQDERDRRRTCSPTRRSAPST